MRRTDLWKDPVTDLGYFTDCQIATYEGLTLRKSSPKSELERSRRICELMLTSCRTFQLAPEAIADLDHRFETARAHDKTFEKPGSPPPTRQ